MRYSGGQFHTRLRRQDREEGGEVGRGRKDEICTKYDTLKNKEGEIG